MSLVVAAAKVGDGIGERSEQSAVVAGHRRFFYRAAPAHSHVMLGGGIGKP